MQQLLGEHGVQMSKRQIAMAQNGDLSLNLTPEAAAQMWRGGLINESQLGAIANGGRARFSFADNDVLVSSSVGFQQSARNDTSTRFGAGKQAGPDTIEHFLSSGDQGQAMMQNWLRGGFVRLLRVGLYHRAVTFQGSTSLFEFVVARARKHWGCPSPIQGRVQVILQVRVSEEQLQDRLNHGVHVRNGGNQAPVSLR